jgi:hypothetical protein
VAVPARSFYAVTVGAVAMMAGGLVLTAAVVTGPHLLASEPDLRPGPDGSRIGEADGWVMSANRSTNVVRISSSFLGLSSVRLMVTPETLIVVGDREGGFGDVSEGRRVRAAYEERPEGFRAKSIEVGTARAREREALGQPPLRERPPYGIGGGAAANGLRADGEPSNPVGDSPGERARKPAFHAVMPRAASRQVGPVPRRPHGSHAEVERNRRRSGMTPSTGPSGQAQPLPERPRASSSGSIEGEGHNRAGVADSRQAHDEADPAAVIDWLLKRSRRPGP